MMGQDSTHWHFDSMAEPLLPPITIESDNPLMTHAHSATHSSRETRTDFPVLSAILFPSAWPIANLTYG